MDYELVKKYDRDYNQTNVDAGHPELRRYILDPPKGKIGGHCVTQNTRLLQQQFPDPIIDLVIQIDDFYRARIEEK
jgi:uncharacterized protein (DUF1919 family)